MVSGPEPTHILILGGGYVGLYTALRLQKKLRAGEASVTVVDPQPHMTYQPFLPEAAAGSIEPRHVVVPLRRVLRGCRVVTARVQTIEHDEKTVTLEADQGHVEQLTYDMLVIALGSVPRLLPIPGLAEEGIGFKTIGEAIYLRNHVLAKLDEAENTRRTEERDRLLTFTVVGGGFAGIEVVAELEDMTRSATRYYEGIDPDDIRWVLVEAADRILPEVRATLGVWTVEELERRGVEVHLSTAATSFENGQIELSDGTRFTSDTVIWTAGVKGNPVLAKSDLPTDRSGRLQATTTLQVDEHPDIWTAGDTAAIPDLSRTATDPTAICPPNAQHAIRQARRLAQNIVRTLRGAEPKEYRHTNLGAVAGLGMHKGVADVLRAKIKGLPAWLFHRAYHLKAMPTFDRKVRILLDWVLASLFRREFVSLGQINNPKEEFSRASQEE